MHLKAPEENIRDRYVLKVKLDLTRCSAQSLIKSFTQILRGIRVNNTLISFIN